MNIMKMFPGVILAAAVAFLACWLEGLLPIHLIGSAVIAMFLGMILNHFLKDIKPFSAGLKFTSKKLLKLILLFPIMGRALGMTDQAFGIWAGTAVNDTSSVVATGYAFSEAAGDFATMVKLTRTLAIIPTVVIFALIQLRLKRKEALAKMEHTEDLKANFSISEIFPWFILGFLGMSIVASIFPVQAVAVSITKKISKFLMVCALSAIGLNTSFSSMKKAGIRPMIHGFLISALVVIVALLVEMAMGIV